MPHGEERLLSDRDRIEGALRESEERYRSFIANSSEGIWRFEMERPVPVSLGEDEQIELYFAHARLAECNDATARMYGYTSCDEIVGARLGDFLVRTEPRNIEYLRAFVRSGYRLTDVESVEVDREGRRKYFSNSLVGVVEGGLLLRAWGTQRDVTEVRESESRYQRAAESGRVGVWDLDVETGALYLSPNLKALLGFADDELPDDLGVWCEMVHPDDRERVKAASAAHVEGRTPRYEAELRRRHKDGRYLWFLAQGVALRDESGKAYKLTGSDTDITDRRRVEEELRESEERYRSLMDNANDIIYSHDLSGNYLSINRAGAEITGYTREEILGGLNIAEVVAPEHLERAKRMTLQKLVDPSPTVYEIDILTRDRRRLTLEVSTRISYRDGQPAAVEGVARDVTARKRAQANERFLADATTALSASLDYETTLATVAGLAVPHFADWCAVDMADESGALVHLAVAHVDPEKVAWAHAMYERYPVDPAKRRGIYNVLRTGVSEFYPEVTDEILARGARDEEHLKIMRQVGFRSVMLVPLKVRERVLGVLTFVNSDSGRAHTKEDLVLAEALAGRAALAVENARLYEAERRLRAEAEAANRLKDEFLATVSHELRTPLTAIVGWSSMLRNDEFDRETTARALEVIERSAKAQAQIVEDILDVSRIITGKIRLDARPADPAPIVSAALESIRPTAAAKGVRVTHEAGAEVGAVWCDPARLQQVLWNLLSNAVKFTQASGEVTVRLTRAGSHARITVSDTGQGISADFLPFVFDRFRQADGTTTRAHGGLGLGLAIVRHLVDLHGGEVRAESEGLGRGSTFTVDLPLVELRNADFGLRNKEENEAAPDGESATRNRHSAILSGVRVLIVDDEADARGMLTAIVGHRGARALAVGSVPEALEALAGFRPDVIVSDIGMPGEDGYSLIQKVRSLGAGEGGQVPAVALTAYARDEDRSRALASGYQVHMPKPINPSELVSVIKGLVGLSGGD